MKKASNVLARKHGAKSDRHRATTFIMANGGAESIGSIQHVVIEDTNLGSLTPAKEFKIRQSV